MQTRLHAPVEARSVDRDNLTVDIVASTFTLDSYETRFDQSGWILSRFLSNPVVTWAHDDRGHTPSAGLPIANAIPETVRIQDGKLQMRLRFTPEEDNPFGYRVFRLIANGFLHGLSVGFDAKEWEDTTELIDGEKKTVRIFRKIELQEVAVVTIPSNAETLVQRAVALNQDPEEAKRLAQDVELEAAKIDMAEFVKYRTYFEKKQPANREATRVMEKFFKRILKEEQPADEVQAWQRMGDAVDAMEEKVETPVVEQKLEEPVTPPTEEKPVEAPVVTEPTPPNPVPAEAPQDERTASVQIPLSVLAEFPSRMTKALTDAGIEALRRGIPIKDACKLIDGMNSVVGSSISHISHGSNA